MQKSSQSRIHISMSWIWIMDRYGTMKPWNARRHWDFFWVIVDTPHRNLSNPLFTYQSSLLEWFQAVCNTKQGGWMEGKSRFKGLRITWSSKTTGPSRLLVCLNAFMLPNPEKQADALLLRESSGPHLHRGSIVASAWSAWFWCVPSEMNGWAWNSTLFRQRTVITDFLCSSTQQINGTAAQRKSEGRNEYCMQMVQRSFPRRCTQNVIGGVRGSWSVWGGPEKDTLMVFCLVLSLAGSTAHRNRTSWWTCIRTVCIKLKGIAFPLACLFFLRKIRLLLSGSESLFTNMSNLALVRKKTIISKLVMDFKGCEFVVTWSIHTPWLVDALGPRM